MNGQEELGLGILKKNHKNLESAFGIVSEESALSLKLIGSVELTLGKRVVNPARPRPAGLIFADISLR